MKKSVVVSDDPTALQMQVGQARDLSGVAKTTVWKQANSRLRREGNTSIFSRNTTSQTFESITAKLNKRQMSQEIHSAKKSNLIIKATLLVLKEMPSKRTTQN